jgi:hypothetical protein
LLCAGRLTIYALRDRGKAGNRSFHIDLQLPGFESHPHVITTPCSPAVDHTIGGCRRNATAKLLVRAGTRQLRIGETLPPLIPAIPIFAMAPRLRKLYAKG